MTRTTADDAPRGEDSHRPVLVAASHGTSDPAGQRAVAGLVAAVRATLSENENENENDHGVEVCDAFVDVQQPAADDLVRQLAPRPVVVVPLLLSAGYHVYVDLTRAAAARPGVLLAGALGPDPRLTAVLATRLRETTAHHAAAGLPEATVTDSAADGLREGERPASDADLTQDAQATQVVLVAAGSSDARAVTDCGRAADDLARALDLPVTTAYLSAAHPTVPEAIRALRSGHPTDRIAVVSYLLAPGYFQDLLVRRATEAGADAVTAPLLEPDADPDLRLVELVVDRYRARVSEQQVPVQPARGVD